MFNEKMFVVDNHKISIADLGLFHNQIYGRKNLDIENDGCIALFKMTQAIESLYNFYQDINNNTFLIKIFETKRDLVNYIFVDGQDTEQLIDSFMLLLENKDYKLENEYCIFEWNGNYVYIQY